MRKVNVYKFSEKLPDEGALITIIPPEDKRPDGEPFFIGKLVNNLKLWQSWYNDPDNATDDKDELLKEIEDYKYGGRYMVIEWETLSTDDHDYEDTHVEDILDWEWMEV